MSANRVVYARRLSFITPLLDDGKASKNWMPRRTPWLSAVRATLRVRLVPGRVSRDSGGSNANVTDRTG